MMKMQNNCVPVQPGLCSTCRKPYDRIYVTNNYLFKYLYAETEREREREREKRERERERERLLPLFLFLLSTSLKFKAMFRLL